MRQQMICPGCDREGASIHNASPMAAQLSQFVRAML